MPDERTRVLDIEELTARGHGVATADGLRVEVPRALPGELVEAQVGRRRRGWAAGELVRLLRASSDRVTPPCPHYGECGGCSLQHASYEAQLRFKRAWVQRELARAGIAAGRVLPVLGDPTGWGYRNKMELTFSAEGVPGLHRRGDFRTVLDVPECALPGPGIRAAAHAVRDWARISGLAGYDKQRQEGFLRHVVLREAATTGEVLVVLETTTPLGLGLPGTDELVRSLRDEVPGLVGVIWTIHDQVADVARAESAHVLFGRPYIRERLAGLEFHVEAETFFQTNTRQAEVLVSEVIQGAHLEGNEQVLDLFCGVGTLTLPLAVRARAALGIDIFPRSIEAARANARLNGVEGVEFLAGDVRHRLVEVEASWPQPDVVVLDPPRSGAGGRVMRRLGRLGTRRLVYVSCNPTSLAEDLRELLAFGYQVERVQPVDLFPQTDHVECVVLISRV